MLTFPSSGEIAVEGADVLSVSSRSKKIQAILGSQFQFYILAPEFGRGLHIDTFHSPVFLIEIYPALQAASTALDDIVPFSVEESTRQLTHRSL